jgi:Zn-dependent protease
MSTEQQARAPQPARQSLAWALISTIGVALWLGWRGGWMIALAGVVGILVHEFGHYLAINKAGLGPSRIYLVPFLGGLATQPKPSEDEMTDVVISLAGPALGITASIPFFAANLVTGDPRWLEGAFFVAIINLFNLVPAPPLDGSKALGPVFARVHPQLERFIVIGLGALAVLWLFSRGSFLLAILIGIVLFPAMMGRALRYPCRPLTAAESGRSALLYLGVLAMCLTAIAGVGYGLGLSNPFELLLRYFG